MERAKYLATFIGTCVIAAAAGLSFGYFVIGPLGVSALGSDNHVQADEPLAAYVSYDSSIATSAYYNADAPDTSVAEPLQGDTHNFIVTTHDGMLVIYNAAESTTEFTNIATNALPEADRERLASGISVYSEEALMRILEDYGS